MTGSNHLMPNVASDDSHQLRNFFEGFLTLNVMEKNSAVPLAIKPSLLKPIKNPKNFGYHPLRQ